MLNSMTKEMEDNADQVCIWMANEILQWSFHISSGGVFFMPLWSVENPGAVEAFVFYRALGVACAKLLTKIRH